MVSKCKTYQKLVISKNFPKHLEMDAEHQLGTFFTENFYDTCKVEFLLKVDVFLNKTDEFPFFVLITNKDKGGGVINSY